MITIKSVDEVLALYAGDDRLAFLLNAKEVLVREVINGEFYVQFVYPCQTNDAERYGLLVEGNDIQFPDGVERGQKFRIRNVEEIRQGRKIYKIVEAHHIAFTLGNYFLDNYIDFAAAKTLPEMLTLLGYGTPFSFVVEGSFLVQDIFDWGEKTKFELLQELRQLYSAELYFDNYEITLTTRKGGNYGARVEYRHNMKGIKRKSHDMERITRLYGYGKNGLTIEGLSGYPVKFIDSQYFDPLYPFMGKVEFPEIETQARLLEEMQKHLSKYELPSVTYDVDFIQMEKIDREFLDERLKEAGDTVTCFDEVLGYSFDARADSYDRYPFEKKSGRASLTNFREMKTSDYIFQATVGSKKAITYTTKNAVLKGQKYDDSITLVDGFGMKVADDFNRTMLRIGQTAPGEYGLAMFNKAGVRTIWQDSATGDAVFSGTLQAAKGKFTGEIIAQSGLIGGWTINSNSLSGSGMISGGTINGTFIQGGLIQGTTMQTRPPGQYPRVEFSSTEDMLRLQGNANISIDLVSNPGTFGSPLLYFNFLGDTTRFAQLPGLFRIDSDNGVLIAGPRVSIAGSMSINGGTSLGSIPAPTVSSEDDLLNSFIVLTAILKSMKILA
ncbi:phage tail spike protein [Paenibacillus yanchengensis]|uniref:Phage tail spike protein n=1 Tax=Paenibacillus yanchengensis TaxID=2035833 RepID=A0ABW4YKX4_9BACL